MPRPSSPALTIPCPACDAQAGAYCRPKGNRYHHARLAAAGLQPPASGSTGHARGHPERRKRAQSEEPPCA
jgi:hypothetical protein